MPFNLHLQLGKVAKLCHKYPSQIPGLTIALIQFASILAESSYHSMQSRDLKFPFKHSEIVFAFENVSKYRPAFYILDHDNNIFVVVRGTNSVQDIMTDITLFEEKVSFDTETCYIHSGFFKSARFIYMMIRDFILENYSNRNIYLVGHSLGGSTSTILQLFFAYQNMTKHLTVSTFAFAPAPSLSKIPSLVRNRIMSFVYNKDPVPRLSTDNTISKPLSFFVECFNKYSGARFTYSFANLIYSRDTGAQKPISMVKALQGFVYLIPEELKSKKIYAHLTTGVDLGNAFNKFFYLRDHSIVKYKNALKNLLLY